MVAAAAAFVLMVVMVAAAAAFVLMVVMVAAALVSVVMVFRRTRFFPGPDYHISLHGSGDFRQFRNQAVRILSRQPELPGGKGDHRLFHFRMVIEFPLNLGCTVGAVQILDPVYLSGHGEPSFISIYEQSLMCYS